MVGDLTFAQRHGHARLQRAELVLGPGLLRAGAPSDQGHARPVQRVGRAAAVRHHRQAGRMALAGTHGPLREQVQFAELGQHPADLPGQRGVEVLVQHQRRRAAQGCGPAGRSGQLELLPRHELLRQATLTPVGLHVAVQQQCGIVRRLSETHCWARLSRHAVSAPRSAVRSLVRRRSHDGRERSRAFAEAQRSVSARSRGRARCGL